MAASPKEKIPGFFAELKRRRVPQTALWYVASAVAIVEAANLFLPSLGAPAETVRLLAILAVFGLPIALTLAWVFDVSAGERAPSRPLRIALVAAVSLVSVGAALVVWNRGADGSESDEDNATSPTADAAHVAVLGFNTVGDDEQLKAFAAQLHSRLIDGLSVAASGATTTRRLRVVSRASILPFSTGTVSVDSIRRALKVGTLLEGTVEAAGDAVRVRIRLVDTETGDQLNTKVVEGHPNNRIALIDAVADSVVWAIRTQLGPIVRHHMRLLETRNHEAFDRFMMAMHRVAEFDDAFRRKDYGRSEHALGDADSLLTAAEKLDPKWTEPTIERGRLVRKYDRLAFARKQENRDSLIASGIAHAERALALRPGDVRALALRGELRFDMARLDNKKEIDSEKLLDEAEHDLRAALIRNPTPARVLRLLSEVAGNSGRMEEALEYGERAYKEDPYLEEVISTVLRLYEYSFALRKDAVAAKWCAEGKARFPEVPVFNDCRLGLAAWSDAYPMKPDSAWRLVESLLQKYPAPLISILEPRLHVMAAAVLARNRLPDSARAVLRSARPRNNQAGMLRAVAGVYALLGERDSAFATVQQMVTNTPAERKRLHHSPELRALASDPRLNALAD